MLSRGFLVAILVISRICLARALEELQMCSRSKDNELGGMNDDEDAPDKELVNVENPRCANVTMAQEITNATKHLEISARDEDEVTLQKDGDVQESERGKSGMDRMLLAMVVAYKMKFMALIPTLIGTLILLLASNALAGFFFALFASVVSLKGR